MPPNWALWLLIGVKCRDGEGKDFPKEFESVVTRIADHTNTGIDLWNGPREESAQQLEEGRGHELVTTLADARETKASRAKFHNDGVKRSEANVVWQQKVLKLDDKLHDIIHLEMSK